MMPASPLTKEPQVARRTADPSMQWWLDNRVVLLAFLALGVLVYSPVLSGFFLSDDFVYLSRVVHQPWPDVLLLQPGVFRPLHVLTWLIDYQLWGLNPLGFHVTNVVSHGLTAFTVTVVGRRLFGTVLAEPEARWTSLLAGLVFLVHPSHTEAVSWIIGRHDVLATLFELCSWLAYMRFRAGSGWPYLAFSLAAFFGALLFKESVLTFPLLLFGYEAFLVLLSRWPARTIGSGWTWPAAHLVVLAVYVVVRRLAVSELVSGYEQVFIELRGLLPIANLAVTALRAFAPYVPLQLLPEAPRMGLTQVTILVASVVGGAAGMALVYRIWTRPTRFWLLLAFLLFALLVSCLPTVATSPSIIDSEGERYSYLPSVFAAMAVAASVDALTRSPAVRAGLAAAVLLILTAFLELSNDSWRLASDLSRGVLASLAAETAGDEPLLVVVPDNLNGAFVYRNGLQEALELFGGRSDARIQLAGLLFLRRPDETVVLERVDQPYALTLPGERGTLHAGPSLGPSVTAAIVSLYRLDLTPRQAVRLAYYSAGRMSFAELRPGP